MDNQKAAKVVNATKPSTTVDDNELVRLFGSARLGASMTVAEVVRILAASQPNA